MEFFRKGKQVLAEWPIGKEIYLDRLLVSIGGMSLEKEQENN
jgi:hypothetical protein